MQPTSIEIYHQIKDLEKQINTNIGQNAVNLDGGSTNLNSLEEQIDKLYKDIAQLARQYNIESLDEEDSYREIAGNI